MQSNSFLIRLALLAALLPALTGCAARISSAAVDPDTPASAPAASSRNEPAPAAVPRATPIPHRLEQHGHVRIDDYYWLRDRDNPEVIQYLEAENAYTEAVMAHTTGLQEQLFEEIRGRIQETDMPVPYSRARTLLKREEVLGGYNPADYRTQRRWATARDGPRVPVSLVYRQDLRREGPQPLLLYGYGSYGYSTEPFFSSIRLSLLDRGFIYAIAHIRGGEELGRAWYEGGKLLNKKNTFHDFIDVAEHLIETGYTAPEQLYALGGSAGGLLIGAVVNLRPELFHGVIAAVPFVDIVTTMLDETIPLTTSEYDEWGDPRQPEYYAYMLAYSPYDQVRAAVVSAHAGHDRSA